jgi:hypothetical protein
MEIITNYFIIPDLIFLVLSQLSILLLSYRTVNWRHRYKLIKQKVAFFQFCTFSHDFFGRDV